MNENNQQLTYPLDYISRSIVEGIINDVLTNSPIIGQYTTSQRDNLPAKQGQVIYNTSTNKLNFYTGSAWEAVTSA